MSRKQLNLNLNKGRWGGRREGSGRKRIHSPGVAHRSREKVNSRNPLHINFKYRTFIRNKQCLKLLKRAIVNARRQGLKILHFSMQSNHMHFIIEAESNEILTKGMRSLTITFAKGLKQGKVQLERYHLHVLRSVRETKHAIEYVLFNKQKHEKGTCSAIDEYCSLLSLGNALELIRCYARKKKVTLSVQSKGSWELDNGASYIFKLALSSISRPSLP